MKNSWVAPEVGSPHGPKSQGCVQLCDLLQAVGVSITFLYALSLPEPPSTCTFWLVSVASIHNCLPGMCLALRIVVDYIFVPVPALSFEEVMCLPSPLPLRDGEDLGE